MGLLPTFRWPLCLRDGILGRCSNLHMGIELGSFGILFANA